MKWNARPKALTMENYWRMPRRDLVAHYKADNEAAQQVQVVPRPNNTTGFRICQWNIHYLVQPWEEVLEEILRHDADVVILNEFWESEFVRHYNSAGKLRSAMYEKGYTRYCVAPTCYPTAIFSRLKGADIDIHSVDLGDMRYAVCMGLEVGDAKVWVYGAHLDDEEDWDGQRRLEMKRLLEHAQDTIKDLTTQPVIIAGDFNQQRQTDYAPDEWRKVRENKQQRGTISIDDGVAQLLQENGFAACWDATKKKSTNWDTPYPPASHWTGTIVDYAYGNQVLVNTGTYVSPSGLSDHRLVVTDWELDKGKEQTSYLS